ncbi:MAG: hypothetical protein WAW06_03420, partial [bacterium]
MLGRIRWGRFLGGAWVGALALLVAGAAWAAATWPETRVVAEGPDEIVIEVGVPEWSLEPVAADEKSYTRIAGTGFVRFAREGEPDLPAIPVLLAIPPASEPV